MASWTDEQLDRIFERTNGRCHICRRRLAFRNFAWLAGRGAWEVEHSVPRVRGGSDHLSNLYAACVSCNRSKQAHSTRSARAAHGYRRAPLSEPQRQRNARVGLLLGATTALFVPPHVRVLTMICGAVLGVVVGYEHEPD